MQKTIFIVMFSMFSFLAIAQINYPLTRTEPFDTLIFNKKLSDPFFWMSRKVNEGEMKNWVSTQGKLKQSIFDSIGDTDILGAEIDSIYKQMQDEIWDLQVVNNQFYYYRDIPEKGKSLCRSKTMNAEEEIIFSDSIIINDQKYRNKKEVYSHMQPFVAMMITQ